MNSPAERTSSVSRKAVIVGLVVGVLLSYAIATRATTIGTDVTTVNLTVTGSSTVGNVIAGTWLGTAVGAQYGGTGQNFSSAATGSLTYFSSLGTLGALAVGSANQILTVVAGLPSWTSTPTFATTTVSTQLSVPTIITASGNLTLNPASDVDVSAKLLLNIGSSTTDFTSGGGLTLGGSLAIGGGSAITQHLSATGSITFGVIASSSCATQTMTVTGASAGDGVYAAPTPVASGIETVSAAWSSYVSSTNLVAVKACNPAVANTASVAAQVWRADVWKH